MRYSEARQGRVFVVRLEDGDILHESIERLACEQSVAAAALIVVGGADRGSRMVVGPSDGRARPVKPMERVLDDVHEVTGTGTIFPGPGGSPAVHLHLACGREWATVTGCVRKGVKVWQVMEVIIFELVGTAASRTMDPETGFELLQP